MKLDKIAFAHVVAHCVANGMAAGEYEVTTLDRLIDIEVPEAQTTAIYPKNENVERLMMYMAEGRLKIEAIKEHRAITGMGLKDSKDAVERYWPDNAAKMTKAELLMKLKNMNLPASADGCISAFISDCFT